MCVIKQKPPPAAAPVAATPEPQAQASKKPVRQGQIDPQSRLGSGRRLVQTGAAGSRTLLTGYNGADDSGKRTLLGQ